MSNEILKYQLCTDINTAEQESQIRLRQAFSFHCHRPRLAARFFGVFPLNFGICSRIFIAIKLLHTGYLFCQFPTILATDRMLCPRLRRERSRHFPELSPVTHFEGLHKRSFK